MTPQTRQAQVEASADRILADRHSTAALMEYFEIQMRQRPAAKGRLRRCANAVGRYLLEGLDFAALAYGISDGNPYPDEDTDARFSGNRRSSRNLEGWAWPW